MAGAPGDAVGVELAVGVFGQGVLVLQIGHQQSGGRGDARLDRRDHVLGVDRLGQRD